MKINYSILAIQVSIIAACMAAILLWLINFPYPSPLIKPFLDPFHRWPTEQVREWVLSGEIDPDFLEFFYRDPERNIPDGENIVAPADGKIIEIVDKGTTRYIVIALTFWDVHVQRHPIAGIVRSVESLGDTIMDGEGRALAFLREKQSPVQKRICYAESQWGDVCVRLITSYLARRIEVWCKKGDRVKKGERLGRILLGSTVVLELSNQIPIMPRVGDRLVAGETIVAGELPALEREGK